LHGSKIKLEGKFGEGTAATVRLLRKKALGMSWRRNSMTNTLVTRAEAVLGETFTKQNATSFELIVCFSRNSHAVDLERLRVQSQRPAKQDRKQD
jgi:hypothetical protein